MTVRSGDELLGEDDAAADVSEGAETAAARVEAIEDLYACVLARETGGEWRPSGR